MTKKFINSPVKRHIVGAICIVIVVFLWVFSSVLTQIIFADKEFNKPFFLTYFNTSLFSFYLLGFGVYWRKWSSIPLRNNNNNSNEKTQLFVDSNRENLISSSSSIQNEEREEEEEEVVEEDYKVIVQETINQDDNINLEGSGNNNNNQYKYSIFQIIRISCCLSPIWFLANYTFNLSLNSTSVSTNTILSTLSGFFALVLSCLLKVDKFTIEKLLATALTVGGTVLVSYSALSDHNGSDTLIGDILAIVGAALYGLYSVLVKKLIISEDYLPMPMMLGFLGLFNLLVLWPFFFIINSIGFEVFELPSGTVFLFLLFNGVFGSFVSDLLDSYSVVMTSPIINTVGLSLSIPLAMLSDFIRKHEMFSIMYIFGSILVICGFILANLASSLFEDKLYAFEKEIKLKFLSIFCKKKHNKFDNE
eukprot:gene2795-3475_t